MVCIELLFNIISEFYLSALAVEFDSLRCSKANFGTFSVLNYSGSEAKTYPFTAADEADESRPGVEIGVCRGTGRRCTQ